MLVMIELRKSGFFSFPDGPKGRYPRLAALQAIRNREAGATRKGEISFSAKTFRDLPNSCKCRLLWQLVVPAADRDS